MLGGVCVSCDLMRGVSYFGWVGGEGAVLYLTFTLG